jgi:hypothetical protein
MQDEYKLTYILEGYTASDVLWSVSSLRQLVPLNSESVIYMILFSIFLELYCNGAVSSCCYDAIMIHVRQSTVENKG